MYASTDRLEGKVVEVVSLVVLPKPEFENGVLRTEESETDFPVY